MGQWQIFWKGEEGGRDHFSYLIFYSFSFFYVEITLRFAKLCYVFEEKLSFFSHYNFMKKDILSCLKIKKMSLRISN